MAIARTQIRWNGWGWASAAPSPLAARQAVWRWLAEALAMPALLATPARPLDGIALPAPALPPQSVKAFAAILGADRVHQGDYERAFHARGRSYHDLLLLRAGDLSTAPGAVLYPRGEDDVLAVLRLAAAQGIGVVPFGGGTSVVGGVTAAPGRVTLDMSGMDRVLGIDRLAGTATAQAGIYGPALEKALESKALTLGHFPQSFEFSSLGGWIAHHGTGQDSGRHGRAADWLAGLRVATPAGIWASGDAPASAAGPDLKQMLLGSEGTLGVITQATVRLKPRLTARPRAFLFGDFGGGIAAIRKALQEGLAHVMLRLSDAEETRFYRALDEPEKEPGLFSPLVDRLTRVRAGARRFGGACLLVAAFPDAASARRFGVLAREHGALALGDGPARRWRAGRFAAPYHRDALLDRGIGVDTLETAARWSQLAALHAGVGRALDTAMRAHVPCAGARGRVLAHIGHAYADGASLYFTCIFPRLLEDEIGQWRAIRRAAMDAIVAHGGTISHHHGVGEDKRPWIAAEKGALGLAALRGMKQALDPAAILNPGKLIPPDR